MLLREWSGARHAPSALLYLLEHLLGDTTAIGCDDCCHNGLAFTEVGSRKSARLYAHFKVFQRVGTFIQFQSYGGR
jgi:hypothetical protein